MKRILLENEIQKFKKLLKSKSGNVRPLMEDNETKFSAEPEVGLPYMTNTLEPMDDVEDVFLTGFEPYLEYEMNPPIFIKTTDKNNLIELTHFSASSSDMKCNFQGNYRGDKEKKTLQATFSCLTKKLNVFGKKDNGEVQISPAATEALSKQCKCEDKMQQIRKFKNNLTPSIFVTVQGKKLEFVRMAKADTGCFFQGYYEGGIDDETGLYECSKPDEIYFYGKAPRGFFKLKPEEKSQLLQKCGCQSYLNIDNKIGKDTA